MLLTGMFALAGIVVLLYSEFRAWRHVLLVMLSFVFAIIGGVLGVWIGGGSLSLGPPLASLPWLALPSAMVL